MNIGTIIQWGSDTIPDGWLLCDGSAVSRTTYLELFNVIGTNFGIGDGSTTFNLPDLRGRVGVGKSSTDGEFDTLGETGGEKYHALTVDEIPSHNHLYYGIGGSNTLQENSMVTVGAASGTNLAKYVENTGGSQGHNILQPYIVTNYIIKALIPDTVKISELESVSSITATDVLPIVQNGETKKITTNMLFKEIKGEVLWENTNPTDEFQGQVISIGKDISNYDKIEILYDLLAPYQNYYYYSTKYGIYQFEVVYTTYYSGIITRRRLISFPTNSSIEFGNGYQDGNLSNYNMVPIKIIGYKNITD